MRNIPVTVLAWEGPQARAYLVQMRRAGMAPEQIILMVRDPKAEKAGRDAHLGGLGLKRAEKAQDRAHNFHPYAIRRDHPDLVAAIAEAMQVVVDDPLDFYDEMYDGFDYGAFAPVTRVGANSYKDPGLLGALADCAGRTVIYTGGGIVPATVFDVPGLRIIHVHTGFLPHVRGADVLLWSMLVRGRPGVSAFFMTPGLDEGDVLAARELEPLAIDLPPAAQYDDDTLYRALFSFIDPVIRAQLLVDDVIGTADDIATLSGTAQDLDAGITYHFMHSAVRHQALHELFHASRPSAERDAATENSDAPERYAKFYERVSARAPMRFAMDAKREPSSLRALGIRNRQADYAQLVRRPDRLIIHRAMNEQLRRQVNEWASYDYGEGYYYQSSEELGITGLRDTHGRVEAFGLADLVRDRSVLEIGCNSGFLTLEIAPAADRIVAFELNPFLIGIAEIGARFLKVGNVEFETCAFEDFARDEQYDDVLSFANHHTYDGNTRQSLDEFFARCHQFTKPGGRLIFESHPPELEGDEFGETVALIERHFEIESSVVHEYGTFLDAGRRFIIAHRR